MLTLSAELKQIGIVLLQGSKEGNIEGADLIVSGSKRQLLRTIQELVPQLLSEMIEPIVSASVTVASIQNEEERQSIINAKIIEQVRTQQEHDQFSKMVIPYMGGAIKPAAELLIGNDWIL